MTTHVAEVMKICRRCGKRKPASEFSGKPKHFHKTKSTCKACKIKYVAAWQKANPGRVLLAKEKNRRQFGAAYNARRHYGLPFDVYFEMVSASKGLCAICEKPEVFRDTNGRPRRSLSVDHDHSTGKVRGLLCAKCNVALGAVGESIPLLRKLISYLRRHSV